MKKKISLILALILAVSLFSACGQSAEPAAAPEQAPAESAPADASPAREADEWADAPKINIVFANVTSDNAKDAGSYFKEQIEARTGGTVTVELYNDNVLGDDLTECEMCEAGDIGIVVTATSSFAPVYTDFFAFDAPFMFIDKEDAYAKLDGEAGQAILDNMESVNMKGLAYWESGFRHLTNNENTATTPDAIKDLKIRVMENDVHISAWKAWGANPTPMSFSELYTALQQGTVDGMECPLGVIYGNNFQEVQKYLTLTGHVYTPFSVLMNLDLWNSMNEAQQQVLMECMKEATEYERERSTYYEQEILDKMEEQGIIVTEPTAEEKQLWKDLVLGSDTFDLVREQMEHPELLDALIG